jgi:hypothetical protein
MFADSRPPQCCPSCKSLLALPATTAVVTCYGGKRREVGTMVRCVECGLTYYALRDGRTGPVHMGAPRSEQEPAKASPGPSVARRERPARERPVGLEDMRLRPAEPNQ